MISAATLVAGGEAGDLMESDNHIVNDEWPYDDEDLDGLSRVKLICEGCAGTDPHLQDAVARATSPNYACSYCGFHPAAPIDVLIRAFMVGVHHTFDRADDVGMPLDEELVTLFRGDELPYHLDGLGSDPYGWNVSDDVGRRVPEGVYILKSWKSREPTEEYALTWSRFRQQIMHRTRFVFWAVQRKAGSGGVDQMSVAAALDAIGRSLRELGAIRTLPPGTSMYRVRGHDATDESKSWAARDLGTNRPELSVNASRMSPAGIPLFYAAEDVETALAEVARTDPREYFTSGRFATTKAIDIVDLSAIPSVPSPFDPELGGARHEIEFLHELIGELRQPVDHQRGHLDYIPTQVFSEYMLHVFDGADVKGIAWNSVASLEGRLCFAVNIAHENCIGEEEASTSEPQLRLANGSLATHQRRTNEFRTL
ncbi:RES domain-containing protein [Micromonospora sp. PLK6-60]|uniref:RES domain-containing protein n=1 Tax=Micromonospora sp. PLK6-60 TaxID=2873383 RepID=UPI001CA66E33|nr:RES domain-containing protein [Micromonospora sp. PLK6-60]MBY8873990.1 RES domain-containing protein [Micromonospora sp. PLK6-60]